MKPLTERQMRFCHEYMKDGNGSRAYRDAGFKAKNESVSRTEASKLLTKPSVALYLKQLQQKSAERAEVTIDRVINELVETAFGSMEEIVEIDDNGIPKMKQNANLKIVDAIGGSTSSSFSSEGSSDSQSFTVKRSDKVKALDMLCKLLGLYEKRDTESGRNLQANADRVLAALRRFKKEQ